MRQLSMIDRHGPLRLAYLTLVRVLGWLALLARSDTAKDAEILCSVTKSPSYAGCYGQLMTKDENLALLGRVGAGA